MSKTLTRLNRSIAFNKLGAFFSFSSPIHAVDKNSLRYINRHTQMIKTRWVTTPSLDMQCQTVRS